MANPWLRLWVDMPTDPKWRTISRACNQPIPSVISVYLFMLVNASNADERGRTQNLIAEDIASALDLQVADVDSILTTMEGRVIEDGVLTGWGKRQPIREDGAAGRAKAWRERNRTQPNADERPEEIRGDTEKKEQQPAQSAKKTALQAAPELLSPDQVAGTLPLVDGTDYQISKTQVAEWRDAYPAVDVIQQLKEMKVWIQANPIKRKTSRGIAKFIVSWLSRAQDKPHIGAGVGSFKPRPAYVDPLVEQFRKEREACNAR